MVVLCLLNNKALNVFLFRLLYSKVLQRTKKEIIAHASQEWRKKVKVSDLCDGFTYPEYKEVDAFFPRYFHKTDKLGRPIIVNELGYLKDIGKLFEATTEERFLQDHTRSIEKITEYRLPACFKKDSRCKSQIFNIVDLNGVSLSVFPAVSHVLRSLMDIDGYNYPETLGCMCIINAPMLFTAVWNVIKRFLDPSTIAKINIVGSNYKGILLSHIEKENLPRFLGGSCGCSQGCRHSDVGPWNDGTVPGYPIGYWEGFRSRDEAARIARDALV